MKRKDLKIWQEVTIYPTYRSISKRPFTARITREHVNWTTGSKIEWCTYVLFKHSAVINDYLLSRMKIGSLKWYQKILIYFRLGWA